MKTLLLFSTLLFSVGVNAEENFIPEEAAPTVEEALANSESPLEYHSSNMFEIPSQKVVLDPNLATAIGSEASRKAAESKYGVYTPLKELEITSVPLIAFGFIAKADKKNFRAARNNFIPSYKNRMDDWLQHVPLIATTAMNFAGYEGRSNHWRYLASGAMSYGFMALFTNVIKYSAKEMRPDGSTANSFPSGHTATAFVAATIMHKEYGLTRSPWWSVLAYGCATTTGIMRTLNNRHWISDILVGAGIGVISTDLGYMLGDFIFKKKRILREPRQGAGDMWQNPSFFRLELGMQFSNNLNLPTNTSFLTYSNLFDENGNDDLFQVNRNGNPFRIPDNYNSNERTYKNYGDAGPAYGEGVSPKIKVATGTTVGAEAAYFINKYIGAGLRARITTAPVTAEGLYSYDDNMNRRYNSSSVSDVWSLVDVNLGVYAAWPINPRHNLNFKALYGRRFFGSLDLMAAYDTRFVNQKTGESRDVTSYGDAMYIDKTNADDFTVGVHYTYSLKNGVAVSAFFDYDFAKPEFDVEYNPYNLDSQKMAATSSKFSFKQRINSYTLGASMTVLF